MKSIPALNMEAIEVGIQIEKIGETEENILIVEIEENLHIEGVARDFQTEKTEATEDFQTTSIRETTEAVDGINKFL